MVSLSIFFLIFEIINRMVYMYFLLHHPPFQKRTSKSSFGHSIYVIGVSENIYETHIYV